MNFKKTIILITTSFFLFSSNLSAETEKECFEKISRSVFEFNQGFDRSVLKPIANAYNKLPDPIKKGTGNFTSNIGTLLTVPNHILQGNWKLAGESSASFIINSTVGVLGFGNPAKRMGLENQQEDIGQTLGAYGVSGGCYFVLPIFGPKEESGSQSGSGSRSSAPLPFMKNLSSNTFLMGRYLRTVPSNVPMPSNVRFT